MLDRASGGGKQGDSYRIPSADASGKERYQSGDIADYHRRYNGCKSGGGSGSAEEQVH